MSLFATVSCAGKKRLLDLEQRMIVSKYSQSDSLFQMLKLERLTAVVDIGANPIDSEPPYKSLLNKGLCHITGFEPLTSGIRQLELKKRPQERYLSIVVGDGNEHVFRVCREKGMSSLLQPDSRHLALFNEFQKFGYIEQELRLPTHRLDDIDAIEHLDFLKIDAQGCELEVFRCGQRKLAKTVVVQTEVSFVPLYLNQPAIGAIDTTLRNMGFLPHCFAELKKWPLAPMVINKDYRKPLNQLLEADLVYVKDFTTPNSMEGEQWKHLALIAHHCFRSFDLALLAIRSAATLGVLAQDAPQKYLAILGEKQ
jgi:FkbM family methyltransferase